MGLTLNNRMRNIIIVVISLNMFLCISCNPETKKSKEKNNLYNTTTLTECFVEKSSFFHIHYLVLNDSGYNEILVGDLLNMSYVYFEKVDTNSLPVGMLIILKDCQGFSEDPDYRNDKLVEENMIIAFNFEASHSISNSKVTDITF